MAIKLEEIESKAIKSTYGTHTDPCILCNTELKHYGGAIHLCLCCDTVLARGERCPKGNDEDGEGGSGLFSVGSSCIKRVPKEYRF